MAYAQEQITPYGTTAAKSVQVAQMFNNIAPTYDALNHGMSLGIDRYWRGRTLLALAESLKTGPDTAGTPMVMLDVATGTGDFAIEAARRFHPSRLVAIDISARMISMARRKVRQAGLGDIVSIEQSDGLDMLFDDDTFDAATVAFGIRNFSNLDRGLREIWRVLKPGGRIAITELGRPRHTPVRQLFDLYANTVLPLYGWLFPRDAQAYRYLTASIEAFPQAEVVAAALQRAGFTDVDFRHMTFGLCTRYVATKKVLSS